jgi:hypothetical protein
MAGKKDLLEKRLEGTGLELGPLKTVLIRCTRVELSPDDRQAIKNVLARDVAWDALLKQAAWQRLSGLVAYHLMSPELRALVPPQVQQMLRQIRYNNLARNMLLQKSLAELLTDFLKEEIPVIVLKGSALLENVYGSIDLRPMGDLDIMVRPEHLYRAEAIAFRHGYIHLTGPHIKVETVDTCHHLTPLRHPRKQIVLEIHHHILSPTDPCRFDLEELWTRARQVTISGIKALALSPEDQLIHISIKFLLDRRYLSKSALGQLCDVSEVIRYFGDSLDWGLIEKTSQENRISRGLSFVLYTCRYLLQAPVPADVLDRLLPGDFDPALAEMFIRRRVLDTRLWLAHGLADSQEASGRDGTVRAIGARLVNFTRDILSKKGKGAGTFELRRAGNILPRLVRALFRPAELKEDLQLDRWLHEQYKEN